jgi:alkylmercury lyase
MTESAACYDGSFLRGVRIELLPHAVRLLAGGRPVDLAEIASAAGVPVEQVEHLLRDQPGCEWDRCPATGRSIRVQLSPEAVESVDPEAAVVSVVFASKVKDIRGEVCDHGHLFASAQAADGWSTEHEDGGVIGVREAFGQARQACQEMGWLEPQDP